MANTSCAAEMIGQTAGDVWQLLHGTGPMPISERLNKIDAPRDLVMQSIGWLAREEKLTVHEERRRKIASLLS
jgi:hypothetical protein